MSCPTCFSVPHHSTAVRLIYSSTPLAVEFYRDLEAGPSLPAARFDLDTGPEIHVRNNELVDLVEIDDLGSHQFNVKFDMPNPGR